MTSEALKTSLRSCMKLNIEDRTSLLLQAQNIHGSDGHGGELLFIAVKKQYVDIVDILSENGVDVNTTDEFRHTALHFAVIQEKKYALQRYEAARNLDRIEAIANILLSRGADVNARTINGFTPLHYAVNFGYTNVVSVLLQRGADVNMKIHLYVTHAETGECFCMADQQAYVDIAHLGHFNEEPTTTILHVAVRNKYADIVKKLLHKGAKVDAKQYDGNTPLMLAAAVIKQNLDIPIIDYLLEYGANINIRSESCMTPLHCAVMRNRVVAVKKLLREGAEVDSYDCRQHSPLMFAVLGGHAEVVKILLSHGANINRRNRRGLTPLDVAINMSYQVDRHLVGVLFAAGAGLYVSPEGRIMRTEVYCHYANYNRTINALVLCKVPSYECMMRDLELLKSKVVYGNLTVNHLLKGCEDPVFIANECFMRGIEKIISEVEEKNVYHKNILSYAKRKMERRYGLLNNGQYWLDYIISVSGNFLPMLPKEIVRKIITFMNDEEIADFINETQIQGCLCAQKVNYLKMNRCRKRKIGCV